ncbi:SH3 domain-containing protein 19-like isoform X3 [Melanotaenia boesemani]|uniref:SH3 domain-containing protein 19-like isoform X3 n=1 Tax=Melanotaenia boesemani TaxID=1250792 RepID=UPI001C04ABC5|nr:SH3 domain-containing protein 19-like isoform X3 [Melanotaenia boesemani]
MAEARSEEEEESMRRETREQVVRRQPNSSGGRPDRRKPEHRHSQGPLSSLRAAIKRTSTRPTSLLETPRDRDRDRDSDRDRDRDRDRRRPEITILSAEPLASTSWFPGAAGGFPPPPPPAAQIWGSTIPPAIQPPPSYEEVIREKTQEQVLLPSSSSSSSSSSCPVSSITIATQTDPGSSPDPQEPQVRRPVRPPRPPLPNPPKSTNVENVTTTNCQSALTSVDIVSVVPHACSETAAHASTDTQCCDLLTELCSPLTSTCSAQTDQWDQSTSSHVVPPLTTSPPVPSKRPTPRPRSKLAVQPISSSVKIQTLVKLREDGLATLAKRAESVSTDQEKSQGKYLQELLEAFSSDDWGFPDHRSDNSELSQSESEEGEAEEDAEDMAALRARIQAFEQQQQVADGSCGDANRQTGTGQGFAVPQRPEPRPRPRLQGQPAKSVPPVIAPKPKSFSPGPKPSSKVFWEDGGLTTAQAELSSAETTETSSAELNSKLQTVSEPAESSTTKSAPSLEIQPCKTIETPSLLPKPQSVTETLSSNTPAPVPAPRPPPPKLSPSLSGTPSPPNPRPPPRPPIVPRASVGAPHQDQTTVEVGSGTQTKTQAGSEPTQSTTTQTVKEGSVRPGVPTKPAALTSPRRASAPNLAPKPISVLQTPPDPNPAPTTPTPAAALTTPRLSGPALTKPPSPAPAMRKSPLVHTKSEIISSTNPSSSDPPLPPRPSSVKLLPLRPPPIKSVPVRPPPPAVNSSSSSSQMVPPPKVTPPVGVKTSSSLSSVSANQIQAQRAAKKGPPLPPRPKPGHPLYTSYMEVLIVLDDPSPAPSELLSVEGKGQTTIPSLINPSQCLLDLETQPEPVQNEDSQLKPALEGLSLSDTQVLIHLSILPEPPVEQKEQPDPPPISGPRCIAMFDYEGEEEDELTFSQGDVIALIELLGQEWGRGQIHGRIGIFPLSFTEVVEPLPQPALSPGETTKLVPADTAETSALKSSQGPDSDMEEWVVALFDFPGQTAEDLSFHKGALIQVTEHIDAEWRRGKLEGREGLYPAAFTQPYQAQPITGQQAAVKGTAKAVFDFTAKNEDELTLKVGDVVTQVESVDEQWILGVVNGKRGIAPKNYISFL